MKYFHCINLLQKSLLGLQNGISTGKIPFLVSSSTGLAMEHMRIPMGIVWLKETIKVNMSI